MNAVLADSATRHDDEVARSGSLFMSGFAIDEARENSDRANEDQWFTHIARVKADESPCGRNP